MKKLNLSALSLWWIVIFSTHLSLAAPVYIKNYSDFPAYPYNTASYMQGGAYVGCGPTTGAMIMGYFHHVNSLSSTTGLLTNPGTGVNEGLNTAWTLHGSQYMNTQANGFGSVYDIESGIENYSTNRGYNVRVMIHASTTYDPNSSDANWLNQYGPYGDSWDNDGYFWRKNADGTWDIDANDFCDFVNAKISQGIAIFLTIDTDMDRSGDHWVALVGFDKATSKYAYFDTYSTTLQWADIHYCNAPGPTYDNGISMLRSITYIGPINQLLPPTNLVALGNYHGAIPLAWSSPAGSMKLLSTTTNLFKSQPLEMNNQLGDYLPYQISSSIIDQDNEILTVQNTAMSAPTGYNIYRSTSSTGTYTKIASTINRQYYRDESVINGQDYYYKITAQYSNGESDFTNYVTAKAIADGYTINSGWTTSTPTMDGKINTAEWTQATAVIITYPGYSGTVTLYVMNNATKLFMAVDDKRDTHLDNLDQFAIFFDENFDREWPASSPPDEGNFWIAWDGNSSSSFALFGPRNGYWPDNLVWPARTTPAGVAHGISISSNNVQYESSFDLTQSPLNTSVGSKLGILVFTYDKTPTDFNSFWPQQAERLKAITPDIQYWGQAPFSFGNLILAASASTPDIAVNPASWNYGSITVGGWYDKTFVVKNEGTATLNVSNITVEGDLTQFSVVSGGGTSSLAPGATRNVVVRFAPTSAGTKNATTRIFSNDPDENPLIVNITGTGTISTVPDISANPTSWNYGSVAVGSSSDKTFVIKNDGTADLNISATNLTGTNAAEFTIQSGGGSFTLAPAATRNIVVRFSPTSAGNKSANLSIGSNDPDENPLLVSLNGTGTVSANPPIFPTTETTQTVGMEFWVNVDIGTISKPVTNLFGVSFDLNFTATDYIDVVTPHGTNVIPGSLLGSDVIFFEVVDETGGKVSIGNSRKFGQGGVSGSGTVAQVKFVAKPTTPHLTTVQFSISNVFANDATGGTIALDPGSIMITISAGVMVWPGDTNNDKIVNQADVLPLGLHWSKTGPARQNVSTAWIGQLALPWTPEAATYADANGDGSVSQADVLPIGLNWTKTHTTYLVRTGMDKAEMTTASQDVALTIMISGDTTPDKDFYIDIYANNVSDLFGVAYELIYTPNTFIDPLAVELGNNNLLGTDVIFFPMIEKNVGIDSGKVSVGLSRKFGQGGVSGSGLVTRISAHMAASAVNDISATLLSLTHIQANDPNGNPIALDTTILKLVTDIKGDHEAKATGFVLYDNYPNPFNPGTTIEYQLPQSAEVRLTIYDVQGQEVRQLVQQNKAAGHHMAYWDGKDEAGKQVATGLYFYRLTADQFSVIKKCLLMK